MPVISQLYDIKSLIERYVNIQVVSSSKVRVREGGGTVEEFHSNCPWCGGHDRFITRPDTGEFRCIRGCGLSGDAIDFLMWFMGMEQQDAIKELGLEHVSFYHPRPTLPQGKLDPPPEKWQETAKNFVERSARFLWKPQAAEALTYLRARGFDDETIRRRRFGYCPLQSDGLWYGANPEHGGLAHWGLKPEDVKPEVAERGTIRIPPGIVIPWFESETLWKVAIKRFDQSKPHDYGEVAGSRPALYNLDSIQPDKPILLVEAEFCAAAVEQAVPDLVAVVATGSDMKGRSPRFAPLLESAPYLIQSFDNDEPGKNGARYWLLRYDRCFRHVPIGAKDPNDMLKLQVAAGRAIVRPWVQLACEKWENYQHMIPLARV